MSDHHHNQDHRDNAHLDRLGDLLYEWRIRAVLPYLSGRVLDIGCGTNALLRRYGSGVGVDVYQFGGADLIVEDTSNLPYADAEFDTVCIVAALNHIPNRIEVLTESRRLLRENGILLVTMIPPEISRFWHWIRSPWDRDQHERGMHEDEVFGFTRAEVRKMLSSTGFVVEEEKSFMLGINTITIARKRG